VSDSVRPTRCGEPHRDPPQVLDKPVRVAKAARPFEPRAASLVETEASAGGLTRVAVPYGPRARALRDLRASAELRSRRLVPTTRRRRRRQHDHDCFAMAKGASAWNCPRLLPIVCGLLSNALATARKRNSTRPAATSCRRVSKCCVIVKRRWRCWRRGDRSHRHRRPRRRAGGGCDGDQAQEWRSA
jgi:hypothetical protein